MYMCISPSCQWSSSLEPLTLSAANLLAKHNRSHVILQLTLPRSQVRSSPFFQLHTVAGEQPACEQGILYVWNRKAGEQPTCEQGTLYVWN